MFPNSYKSSLVTIAIASALLAPIAANADTSSNVSNWFTNLFNWHVPTTSHFSDILQSRKNNIKSNDATRVQMFDERRGIMSGVVVSAPNANDITSDFTASTSPSIISIDLFAQKKTAIVSQLYIVMNALHSSRADLSDFVAHNAAANTTDTQNALAQADANINAADTAVKTLVAYIPQPDNAGMVNLSIAQNDLDAAVSAITTARTSLKSAIGSAGDSLGQ